MSSKNLETRPTKPYNPDPKQGAKNLKPAHPKRSWKFATITGRNGPDPRSPTRAKSKVGRNIYMAIFSSYFSVVFFTQSAQIIHFFQWREVLRKMQEGFLYKEEDLSKNGDYPNLKIRNFFFWAKGEKEQAWCGPPVPNFGPQNSKKKLGKRYVRGGPQKGGLFRTKKEKLWYFT